MFIVALIAVMLVIAIIVKARAGAVGTNNRSRHDLGHVTQLHSSKVRIHAMTQAPLEWEEAKSFSASVAAAYSQRDQHGATSRPE
jgi:hypothetical protein